MNVSDKLETSIALADGGRGPAAAYTVTLNTGGGNSLAPVTIKYDSGYALPVPVRTGYTFEGWYGAVGGGGVRYAEANGASVTDWKYVSDKTLYASWLGTAGLSYADSVAGVTVSKGTANTDGAVYIQDYYNGKPVTAIGEKAFYACGRLTGVKIPRTVTHIGGSAFLGCGALAAAALPSGVRSIGYYPFAYCRELAGIEVSPQNAYYKSIDGVLFNKDGTTLISYPLGRRAEIYTITDKVRSIDGYAFLGGNRLTAVDVAAGNQYYKSADGVVFGKDGTTLVVYPAKKSGETYAIPDGVKSIGSSAFSWCKGLTGVTIPSGVTAIGGYAFYSSGLKGINIPSGVTAIGDYAFRDCTELRSATIPSSVTVMGKEAFGRCGKLSRVFFLGTQAQWETLIKANNAFML
ncbi:MAG: leucine-rich repeat protein [Clostridiales bacterium]|jgi:uncharacterized repeat protein (TIGR02543 family)|nr:leucine-rich repeat protein [Clostridiales bacterium]